MIKNNPTVRKELSIVDKINMTKDLVSGYFVSGEYTPYYKEINDLVAFFTYCVNGIEFENKKDENGESVKESIYIAVTNDSELMEIWKKRNIICSTTLKSQLESIYTDVLDIADFEKQRLIHSSPSINDKTLEILEKESRNKDTELKALKEVERVQKEQAKQLEYANKIAEMMTPEETVELNRLMIKNGEYNPNEMAKIVADRYFESNRHADNIESVVSAKNDRIRNLEVYKQLHEAKNVPSGK